jgi:DNA modification methylase
VLRERISLGQVKMARLSYIIPYSKKRLKEDLSSVRNIDKFVEEIRKVAEESYRVLKPGKHCAILIGDARKHAHFTPISPRVMEVFLDVGFVLREDIIKLQHKMKGTRESWMGRDYNFLKIAHEHLFVFRKLEEGESRAKFKHSTNW